MHTHPYSTHPYSWLSTKAQWLLFAVLWPLTLAATWQMQRIGKDLRTAEAPQGIVSFELAGNESRAAEMMASWSPQAREAARYSLWVDYLYLVLYSSCIALGCVLAAEGVRRYGVHWPSLWYVAAWAQFAAALLDCIENAALLQVLNGARGDFWPLLARWCALPKFAIVALGILLFVIGMLAWLGRALFAVLLSERN